MRLLSSLAVLLGTLAFAAEQPLPAELEGVGIEEKLGQRIDLNLTFVAENGRVVELKKYFNAGRPVILNLVYYSCPMLCNLVLNGQTTALREIPWTPGGEFEIVTVSIDPTEMFTLARQKNEAYLASYDRPAPGWHFLTDHEGNVKKLAGQVGFRYRYDERQQQYAHAAAILVLTPEGKVSRYLYGVRFKPRDLRLAMAEAAEEKFGFSERLLLYCFHYDPQSRSYVLFAANVMRAGGVVIVLVLGFMMWRFWRSEKRSAAPGLVTAK